jgi:CheY-like chemotaxis protein
MNAAKRILIVDDDAGVRHSLARILRTSGHVVELAADGEEGITKGEAFQPDVLLVDIRMPGIDGIETHRQLHQRFPQMVAISMTAYASSDKTRQAIECGAVSVLSKPLNIKHLMELVQSA